MLCIREGEARTFVAVTVHPTQKVLSVEDVLSLLHNGTEVDADTTHTQMRHSGHIAAACRTIYYLDSHTDCGIEISGSVTGLRPSADVKYLILFVIIRISTY